MAVGDKKPVVMESDRAVPGGVATLDSAGKLDEAQRPDYGIDQVTGLQAALDKKQATITFDAEPTEDSENPVTSGGVHDALSKKQDALTGTPGQLIGIGESGAEATVYPSNDNLLDNWDFANPINQLGKTVYTAAGYTIDRWKCPVSRGYLEIKDDCITLANTTESGVEYLVQNFEHDFKIGDVLTASFLMRGNGTGSIHFATLTGESLGSTKFTVSGELELATYTFTANSTLQKSLILAINEKSCIDILAAKLELGSVQTLAHKEGDQWVLNDPPPNYVLELAKCQRCQLVFGGGAYEPIGIGICTSQTNARIIIPTPQTLRVTPEVTIPEIGNYKLESLQ